MNCHDLQPRLASLLYGELSESEQAAVHAHLTACPTCRDEWDRMRQGHGLLNHLSEDRTAPSLDVWRLLHARTARVERSRRRWRRATAGLGVTAAVMLLAAGIGLRIEVSRERFLLGWGPPPRVRPAPAAPTVDSPRLTELQSVLERQNEQLTGQGELLQLTAREVLAVDGRHSADLSRLRQELAEMQRQHDARWQLLATELLNRDTDLTAMNGLRSQ